MKRLIYIVLLCGTSGLGGYMTSSSASVAAQGQPPQTQNTVPVVEGKGIYWSADDLKKTHAEGASIPLPRTATYNTQLIKRAPQAKPPSSELHTNRAQLFVMVGGSGTVVVGGEAQNSAEISRGEPRGKPGEPLKGGTAYKVKTGDMLLIPAKTWHVTQPDPGGVTYFLVNLMEP